VSRAGEREGRAQRVQDRIGQRLDVARVQVNGRRTRCVAQARKLTQQGRLADAARPEDEQQLERLLGGFQRRTEEVALPHPPDELALTGRAQAIRHTL